MPDRRGGVVVAQLQIHRVELAGCLQAVPVVHGGTLHWGSELPAARHGGGEVGLPAPWFLSVASALLLLKQLSFGVVPALPALSSPQ